MNSKGSNCQMFLKAHHVPTGKQVYVFLSADQLVVGAPDDYTVDVYEDHDCEMVHMSVVLGDLEEFEVQ